MRREAKVALWLQGVSAVVLLIACANVANLLIARTIERRREIAVRLAMGVSRLRLARLLLIEAAIIAALAVLAALVLARTAGRFMQDVLLPDIAWSQSVVDARVLGFTALVAVVCTLLAGLAPTLHGLGTPMSEGLKAAAPQAAGSEGASQRGYEGITHARRSGDVLLGDHAREPHQPAWRTLRCLPAPGGAARHHQHDAD